MKKVTNRRIRKIVDFLAIKSVLGKAMTEYAEGDYSAKELYFTQTTREQAEDRLKRMWAKEYKKKLQDYPIRQRPAVVDSDYREVVTEWVNEVHEKAVRAFAATKSPQEMADLIKKWTEEG